MKISNNIVGIGVDIEDISRFVKLNFNKNQSFYKKMFTDKEIEYCLKQASPYQHFAARFCAKEAFIKASNEKIKDYKSIEIILIKNKPMIKWKGLKVLVSLSHEKDKAIATVLLAKD